MNFPALLLAAATLITTDVLVLRSGERIALTGHVRQENGRVIFRSISGTLYSLPASEVDFAASESAASQRVVAPAETKVRLKASDEERKRLIAELENNHAGKPRELEPIRRVEEPTPADRKTSTDEEWSWRNRAKAHEEAIRRAKENRDLLVRKAEALRSHIAGLISLGYKPNQFSYDTTVLQQTIEEIPYAELEVTRAERAYADFQEEARQRGVLPGWLR